MEMYVCWIYLLNMLVAFNLFNPIVNCEMADTYALICKKEEKKRRKKKNTLVVERLNINDYVSTLRNTTVQWTIVFM